MLNSKINTTEKESFTKKELRWKNLLSLTNRFEKRFRKNITSSDLKKFSKLYFETLSDLSEIRNDPHFDPEIKYYLNNVVGRAYSIIYKRKRTKFRDIVNYFLIEFPAAVRRRIHFIIFSLLILFCSSIVGYLCLNLDSKFVNLVIPTYMQNSVKSSIDSKKEFHLQQADQFRMSSQILFNNIQVSFFSFATGIFFGIGTTYFLIVNGLLIGGLSAIYISENYSSLFWSLIVAHGAIEIPCILFCSAAGFIIGYSMIDSGKHKRHKWFIHEGKDAVTLVAGSIPLLVIAALVESYVTPTNIPHFIKFLISAVNFTILCLFLWKGIDIYKLSDNLLNNK